LFLSFLPSFIAATVTSTPKSADDVVIVSFARTAMCKATKGSFKDTSVELMLSHVFKSVVDQSKIDAKLIEDITVGNCLQPGAGATTSRMAQFLAGIPETTPLCAINRQCSSGLQAVMSIANSIRAGQIDIGIGAGVESMSQYDFSSAFNPPFLSKKVKECKNAANCQIPMGITSENVASQFNVTRDEQDEFAARSFAKAEEAQENGSLNSEISPMEVTILDKDGNESTKIADLDEGVRKGTTKDKLGKLKPVFKKDGTTTAGNSSQLTDGAAAVLLAKRSVAESLGLPIKGRILGYSVVGVDPEIMGIGPAAAIPKALEKSGLKISDIDVYEINEAFASQALYCIRHLGIPEEKVNPRGGAIALGHPLGATGARQIVTLFNELEKIDKKYGVVSMCVGTGMGAAGVFERE
jgi:acetyl-CoA acyltransferase 1